MNKTVIYDRSKYNTHDITDFNAEGYDVLCSVCKAKLIFIMSLEEAKTKKPGHPGIFCPNSPDHVYTTFATSSKDFWKDFRKGMKKRKHKAIIEMRSKGCTEKEIQAHVAKYYSDY